VPRFRCALVVACFYGRPLSYTLLTVLWLSIGAASGNWQSKPVTQSTESSADTDSNRHPKP
jgi:hypothetical protein